MLGFQSESSSIGLEGDLSQSHETKAIGSQAAAQLMQKMQSQISEDYKVDSPSNSEAPHCLNIKTLSAEKKALQPFKKDEELVMNLLIGARKFS